MNPVESVDKCITCSTCLAYCPVMRANLAFHGPKITGPAAQRFRLADQEEDASLSWCSNCKNCDIACPSGVHVSVLNMLARAEFCRKHHPPLRDWILAHGHLLARLMRWMPQPLAKTAMLNPLTRSILDYAGIDRRAPMPAPDSFFRMLHRRKRKTYAKNGAVVFFPGCFVTDYDASTGLALVDLLEMAKYTVLVPDCDCCGLPLLANGFFDDAERAAMRNFDLLRAAIYRKLPILTVCPSCALMLKQEYAEFFPNRPELRQISPLVQDASDFLSGCCARGELDLPVQQPSVRVIYHAPCHLRAQGIGSPALHLLRDLFSAEQIEDARAGCCGISGSYGFKKEKYETAEAVGVELFQTIHASGAEIVLTDCGTCRMQIHQHTGLPVLHPLVWLHKQTSHA